MSPVTVDKDLCLACWLLSLPPAVARSNLSIATKKFRSDLGENRSMRRAPCFNKASATLVDATTQTKNAAVVLNERDLNASPGPKGGVF